MSLKKNFFFFSPIFSLKRFHVGFSHSFYFMFTKKIYKKWNDEKSFKIQLISIVKSSFNKDKKIHSQE